MSALKKIEFEKRTIEPLKDEKEYPHIIEKIDITFFDYDVGTKKIKDKINEIIEVVNIMNRGGRKI